MAEAQEKGDALEKAVKHIETAILKAKPEYNEKNFRINWKKRFVVDEVTHEVDIFVEIDLGDGYNSVFIFECKNRKEKSDKNDIIVFSEKIDIAQAQKGYFVSTGFTRDAEAQARKNPRIILLSAKDIPVEELKGHPGASICSGGEKFEVVINAENGWEIHRIGIGARPVTAEMGFRKFDLFGYFGKWRQDLTNRFNRESMAVFELGGRYERVIEENRDFNGMMRIYGLPIKNVVLKGWFFTDVVYPEVNYNFDINKRGRFIAYEDIQRIEDNGIEWSNLSVTTLPSEDGIGMNGLKRIELSAEFRIVEKKS